MASGQNSPPLTVPELMGTIKQLSPAKLRQFTRAFARWQQHSERPQDDEALVEACRARLAPAEERRLRKLIAKSERGILTAKELENYQALVRRAEALDATRLAALTQLAKRWDKPVRTVMQIVGWEGGKDETTNR